MRETFKVEPPAGPWSAAAAAPTAATGYPTENSILAQLVTWGRSVVSRGKRSKEKSGCNAKYLNKINEKLRENGVGKKLD